MTEITETCCPDCGSALNDFNTPLPDQRPGSMSQPVCGESIFHRLAKPCLSWDEPLQTYVRGNLPPDKLKALFKDPTSFLPELNSWLRERGEAKVETMKVGGVPRLTWRRDSRKTI